MSHSSRDAEAESIIDLDTYLNAGHDASSQGGQATSCFRHAVFEIGFHRCQVRSLVIGAVLFLVRITEIVFTWNTCTALKARYYIVAISLQAIERTRVRFIVVELGCNRLCTNRNLYTHACVFAFYYRLLFCAMKCRSMKKGQIRAIAHRLFSLARAHERRGEY